MGVEENEVDVTPVEEVDSETVTKEEVVAEETVTEETSNKVFVEKEGDGGIQFNFGSDGKINFG